MLNCSCPCSANLPPTPSMCTRHSGFSTISWKQPVLRLPASLFCILSDLVRAATVNDWVTARQQSTQSRAEFQLIVQLLVTMSQCCVYSLFLFIDLIACTAKKCFSSWFKLLNEESKKAKQRRHKTFVLFFCCVVKIGYVMALSSFCMWEFMLKDIWQEMSDMEHNFYKVQMERLPGDQCGLMFPAADNQNFLAFVWHSFSQQKERLTSMTRESKSS